MVKGRGTPWYPNGFNYNITDDQGKAIDVVATSENNRLTF
jgi:hypothetical protein